MVTTLHAHQRMNQRGITKEMVDVVLEHGSLLRDKAVLGKRNAHRLIEETKSKLRVLQKIADKGGVVVVADGETIITTYNYGQGA